MTNKQKAEEIASKIIAIDAPITYSTLINAMMEMAKYKDREVLKTLQNRVKELSDDLLSEEEYTICP